MMRTIQKDAVVSQRREVAARVWKKILTHVIIENENQTCEGKDGDSNSGEYDRIIGSVTVFQLRGRVHVKGVDAAFLTQ
jgi:hypothetical protein